MPPESTRRSSSWIFWLSYTALVAYWCLVFIPGVHCPKGLDSLLLIVSVIGSFPFGKKEITTPQLYFSLLLGVFASGIGIVYLWNSPVVIVMVPAFLFMLLFFVFVLRVMLRRRRQYSLQ